MDWVRGQMGTYVRCINSGDDHPENSHWVSIKEQGEFICNQVMQDPELQGEFNLFGNSQGTITGRYLIQFCPLQGRIRNWVANGGPVNGVSAMPHCEEGTFCVIVNTLAGLFLNFDFLQAVYAPSNFWRTPGDETRFKIHSAFLAEANNELDQKNETIKQKFLQLNHARFIKFTYDQVVLPKDSSWWGKKAVDGSIIPKEDQAMYKEDWFGLRTMEEEGRTSYAEVAASHCKLSHDDWKKHVFPVFRM